MRQLAALYGQQVLWRIDAEHVEYLRACHYVQSASNVGITKDMTLTCSEVKRAVLVIVVIRM